MKKLSLAIAAAFIPIPYLIAPPSFAFWRMQAVFGQAQLNGGYQLRQGQDLRVGDQIVTGRDGTVFGIFQPMGVQTLTVPFAELTLSAYTQNKQGGRSSVWYLGKGITDFKVPRLRGCNYQPPGRPKGCNSFIRVISRYGVTDIKGTQLSFRNDTDKGTVGVLEGNVVTSNAGVGRTVKSGQFVFLRAGRPPSVPIEADRALELKVNPTYQGQGQWKGFVASGNFIIKDGQIVGESTLIQVGDRLRVQNPIGQYLDYDVR